MLSICVIVCLVDSLVTAGVFFLCESPSNGDLCSLLRLVLTGASVSTPNDWKNPCLVGLSVVLVYDVMVLFLPSLPFP